MSSRMRSVVAAVVLLGLLSACGERPASHGHPRDHGHVHAPRHGGKLVELGEETYHLELLRDREAGRLTAWVLDGHVENYVRLSIAEIELVGHHGGVEQRLPLRAVANDLTGETLGDTAQFEGEAEWLREPGGFAGVVSLEVRGRRFERVPFELSD